jgi:hypothetical protein
MIAKPLSCSKLNGADFWSFYLSESASNEVSEHHARVLIDCYIAAQHLQALADGAGVSLGQQLQEVLPDAPHIRSGDFGEILCRSTLLGFGDEPEFPVYRWRNRSHKNDTVRGMDLIGYVKGASRKDDRLVVCEVKTRATTPNQKVAIDCYEQLTEGYVTRAASALLFAHQALLRDGQTERAAELARFRNPHEHGSYRWRLTASVVHDSALWQDSFLDALPGSYAFGSGVEVQVVVIRVAALMVWIDLVYDGAIADAAI